MKVAIHDASSRCRSGCARGSPGRPWAGSDGAGREVSTRAAASARRTPPTRGVWEGQLE